MKHKTLKTYSQNPQVRTVKYPLKKMYWLSISFLSLLAASLLLLSCNGLNKEVSEGKSQSTVEVSISENEFIDSIQNYEIVPNEKVCMVNDRFMGVDQIPINVEGITYYGCCEGCVKKLQENLNDVRFGTNPINDTRVNKASAVIVQDKSNGSVFYFASKQDAQAFINKKKV